MMTHTAQSVPQKGTKYTQLSVSIHPNTTNRKQSLLRTKPNQKQSYFESFDHKSYSNIIENANRQLQEYLFNLNEHMKKVIQKREANYIAAFENHILLVQKQLKKIKKDAQYANSKQRTISLQEVIARLEKQCAIFRQQAMKYFQLLEEKEQTTKNLKRQLELVKRQLQVSEFSKKKIFQRLKLDLGINDLELLEGNQQFYKEFKKTKDRTQTEISTGFKDRKFRKTLLDFDLKNSSEYFKQPTTSRKTARSFLTLSSFRQDLNKFKTFDKKQTIYDETKCKDGQRKSKRVNSVIDINCNNQSSDYRENFELESKHNHLKDLLGSQLNEYFKQIMLKKFILSEPQKNEFKFNSEQDIDNFIQIIFGGSLLKNSCQTNKQKIDLQLQQMDFSKIKQKSVFPFERNSTHKKFQRVLNSSIYTVEKTQKDAGFVTTDDSPFKIKDMKHTVKKGINSSNWIAFRLNRSEIKSKTRLQKNLSSYMERQSLKNVEQ